MVWDICCCLLLPVPVRSFPRIRVHGAAHGAHIYLYQSAGTTDHTCRPQVKPRRLFGTLYAVLLSVPNHFVTIHNLSSPQAHPDSDRFDDISRFLFRFALLRLTLLVELSRSGLLCGCLLSHLTTPVVFSFTAVDLSNSEQYPPSSAP